MKAAFLIFLLSLTKVEAMPCDSGYECLSKSKKYHVSLQRCRERNHINLLSMSINKMEINEAILNQGWDGETILAFEIKLPILSDDGIRILTAEINKKSGSGIMKIRSAETEPGPLKLELTEKMQCKIEN